MLDRLDAAAVRQWCAVALAGLRAHRQEIDQLNVYPVPDGDTGTNLVLTVAAAVAALDQAADPGSGPVRDAPDQAPDHGSPGDGGPGFLDGAPGPLLRRLARGALLGARGNSGVIVSQLYAGLADALDSEVVVGGRAAAKALDRAAVVAYRAVAEPAEGTVLSVARAAADAAGAVVDDDLVAVVRAAASAAREALARTPEQLPALARAGVVDAGGRGLVVLLDALVEVVTGQAPPALVPATAPAPPRGPREMAREAGSDAYAYEVQYLLEAEPEAVERLKRDLAALGDSLLVVGTGGPDEIFNVHVHVNDIGAAIEAGIEAGRPYRVTVTRFADQIAPVAAASRPDRSAPPADRAVVVVVGGDGLVELFAAEGAVVVGRGPGNAAPSTGEILDAIGSCGSGRVVVLPNDPNVVASAGAAAEQARGRGIEVAVVPTRSPVQALAALAVRDPARHFRDDVIAMAEAAGACRYAEVTTASREALTVAGRCQPGDVLALVEGEVNLIGQDLELTCRQLIDRLLAGGGELLTLVAGIAAPQGLAEALVAHVAEHWPFAEVQCFDGGQPHYPLLVGVE